MNIYDQYISTKLQEFLLNQDAERRLEKKAKDSFWATEAETPLLDLYHKWIGTPPTNPIDAEKLVMFNAAKMMELALVQSLEAMGALKQDKRTWLERLFGKEEKQTYFRMERYGVTVSGYMDAVFCDGTPLEIKTFYGDYQARELKAGKPRSSYLKQLAIYMDALDQYKGKLIYMDRGTGEMYEFVLDRDKENPTKFKCLNVEFDLDDTYKKWSRLYRNNILKRIEPKPQIQYKIPVEQIDWSSVSKAQISKARNNRAVIGDWQVKYSPYKERYLEIEKTIAGYTNEELEYIKEQTAGYSTK